MTDLFAGVLQIRTPQDLLAFVPYVLGFTPADSLVAIALDGDRIVVSARADLPDPADTGAVRGAAASVAKLSVRQKPTQVILIGYGQPARVQPVLDAAHATVAVAGVPVERFRVTGDRFYRDDCPDSCCPAEGTPFDPAGSPVAAHAVYAGLEALPDRQALVAQLTPVDGPARAAMNAATEGAVARMLALLHPSPADPAGAAPEDATKAAHTGSTPMPDRTSAATVEQAGRQAVTDALRRYQQGGQLTDDEAAWLSVLLVHLPTRDHAWRHTDSAEHHVRLWTDLTRRADPQLVAAPASLLAFAAWRRGDGLRASIALQLARHADPQYSMARLLHQMVQAAIPPSAVDWTAPD